MCTEQADQLFPLPFIFHILKNVDAIVVREFLKNLPLLAWF